MPETAAARCAHGGGARSVTKIEKTNSPLGLCTGARVCGRERPQGKGNISFLIGKVRISETSHPIGFWPTKITLFAPTNLFCPLPPPHFPLSFTPEAHPFFKTPRLSCKNPPLFPKTPQLFILRPHVFHPLLFARAFIYIRKHPKKTKFFCLSPCHIHILCIFAKSMSPSPPNEAAKSRAAHRPPDQKPSPARQLHSLEKRTKEGLIRTLHVLNNRRQHKHFLSTASTQNTGVIAPQPFRRASHAFGQKEKSFVHRFDNRLFSFSGLRIREHPSPQS